VYGLGYGDEPGMLKYPLECCVDSFGVLYVRDHHNSRVQLFSPDNAQPIHHIEVNSQKETIYSMTVTDNGDIYVAKMVHIQEQDQSGLVNTINKYYIDIY
jgi:sugar lactone lactonase YvrE